MRDEYGAAGSLTNDAETVDAHGTGLLDQSAPPADGVVMCGSKDGLAGINGPGTELVIWQRALPEGLHDWLERTDAACRGRLMVLRKRERARNLNTLAV